MCDLIQFSEGRAITGVWKETGKACFETDAGVEGYDGSQVECLCNRDLGQIMALIGANIGAQLDEVKSVHIDFNYIFGIFVDVKKWEG